MVFNSAPTLASFLKYNIQVNQCTQRPFHNMQSAQNNRKPWHPYFLHWINTWIDNQLHLAEVNVPKFYIMSCSCFPKTSLHFFWTQLAPTTPYLRQLPLPVIEYILLLLNKKLSINISSAIGLLSHHKTFISRYYPFLDLVMSYQIKPDTYNDQASIHQIACPINRPSNTLSDRDTTVEFEDNLLPLILVIEWSKSNQILYWLLY